MAPGQKVSFTYNRDSDKDYSQQRMILGTHTSSNDPNFLVIAEAHLPTETTAIDARKYDDQRNGILS